jgi:hypothetical protein|tara:strand:- start:266 stop:523 length:258 start_codon:yes stop_codon:yes gene_type:complete
MKIKDILDAKLDLRMKAMDLEHEVKMIAERVKQLHREMEQDAEPEGGPVCDQYADAIHMEEVKMREVTKQLNEVLGRLTELDEKY